jgi:2-methylcitrate dehydratase PrpD
MNQPGPYTQQIAAFASAYRYASLPPEAVERAKEIILDTLGAILLGSRPGYRSVRLLGDLARAEAAHNRLPPLCTIVGRDFKGPLLPATLANGTMGYAADAEGGGISRMHAAAVFVPAVLTAGQYLHSSGQEVIAALCLAYDVATRISDAADTGTAYPHAFHPSAVFGHFGAAAAGGHLFQLNEAQFINALGLAGINAGGMIAWVDDPSEDSRGFVIGVAAQNGIRSALLAQHGMGGPIRILDEAKYSIYAAYSGAMHLDRLGADLGDDYRILQAGGYKQYPCCGDIHSGLDALLILMQKYSLDAAQLRSITHWVKPARVNVIDDNFLKSHNAQYILAVAAMKGAIDPDDILIDRREDPAIADLYTRASLHGDPVLDEITDGAPAIVEVATREGHIYKERVDYAKGNRQNPLTQAELHGKFLRWATTAIDAHQAERIIEMTARLEQLDDIGELAILLAT